MSNDEEMKMIRILQRYGYPESFGRAIAQQLRTENSMKRMIGYLLQGKPSNPEEIADEMIAIEEEKQRWIQKKQAEYANQKYNKLLALGLDKEEEE
ncbi:MAG: hypothetical protein LKF53_08425 [Solobacterium sp.]|jgi:hypothetical protein|nr:hypothetical protein [Solobacterium sp.]MCH4227888.1 hypothetical protein [Solobacterium sp.]MCH4283289.1 hypothetical protein [Solobacterium sp.]